MQARCIDGIYTAIHVASIVALVVETAFLLLYLPVLPAVLPLYPFLDAMGHGGLLGEVLTLSPLILYGLYAQLWMARRAVWLRRPGIPRHIRVGLWCRGTACVLLVLAWVGEIFDKATGVSSGSHLIGAWALLMLSTLVMQQRLVGWQVVPEARRDTADRSSEPGG